MEKVRDFEKISFEQFKKDVCDNKELYEKYKLPTRSNKRTAGYDIFLLQDITLDVGEIKKIPTGIKSYFGDNEVLFIIVRSGTGFKYNIRLCNQIAVIDSDYYNNAENEGHIWIKLQNEGNEPRTFKAGESLTQFVFTNYLVTDSDLQLNKTRVGKY